MFVSFVLLDCVLPLFILSPDSNEAAKMKTPKYNLFGRGLKLQIAIMVACQMAFIL